MKNSVNDGNIENQEITEANKHNFTEDTKQSLRSLLDAITNKWTDASGEHDRSILEKAQVILDNSNEPLSTPVIYIRNTLEQINKLLTQ